MSDEGTHIILKVCTKDDDGSYVWRCAECDAKEFHLLVVKETLESLYCTIGDKVSFKFNCSEDPKLCSFEQLSTGINMLRNGTFGDKYPQYQFGEDKSYVTLKDCKFGDEGMYTWKCDGCGIISHFNLTVRIPVLSKGIPIWKPLPAILLVLIVIFAYCWKT